MSVICHHTISLDGFIAGPGDAMEWAFAAGRPTSLADETMRRIGAIVAGRRWHDLATERWKGVDGIYGGAFRGEVFVLTHRPPPSKPRVSFMSGGIAAAIASAKAAAGAQDVGVFGATITQQCLAAGLLDEIVLHVVPILLGGGVRLFADSPTPVKLQRISVGEAPQLTDLHFRVER